MRNVLLLSLLLICLSLQPAWALAEEFACNDGAGGKVTCIPQRGGDTLRLSCKRGSLFEIKWACTAFPETDSTLCRSRDGQQRMLSLADYGDDKVLCSSMCFCPLPEN